MKQTVPLPNCSRLFRLSLRCGGTAAQKYPPLFVGHIPRSWCQNSKPMPFGQPLAQSCQPGGLHEEICFINVPPELTPPVRLWHPPTPPSPSSWASRRRPYLRNTKRHLMGGLRLQILKDVSRETLVFENGAGATFVQKCSKKGVRKLPNLAFWAPCWPFLAPPGHP